MAFDRSNSAHDVQIVGNPYERGTKKIDLILTNQYLIVPDHDDFQFDGDFTIETFGVEFSDVGPTKTIISKGGNSPNWSWYLIKATNGATGINFSYSFNGTTINGIDGALTAVVNTPYNFTVDRQGTTCRLYVDGVMVGSATASGAFNNSGQDLLIGRLFNSTFGEGKIRIKAVRITKGTARYASDSGFTVPTLPLPTQ